MPVCKPDLMAQIIRDGMDDYWRVIYAKSEDGMSQIEIGWRRDHAASIARFEKKYGAELDKFFNG